MQKLISLPENLVSSFHEITGKEKDWFVRSDPGQSRIGSGGGTAWLLSEHKKAGSDKLSFEQYLATGKKLIIHAGGQSRRLPAYAPSGKLLAPVPVFRWSQGQRLDQSLLDLQVPLLDKIMETTGPSQHVIVAAGDILIQLPEIPYELPDADVVCFGMWVDPQLASNHGVFFTPRSDPNQLDFMLQKPEHSTIEKLANSHLYLMDIGIWVLSDRAVELLMKKCGWNGSGFDNNRPLFYDLYRAFGTCLGENPSDSDEGIRKLSTAIVPIDNGEFYHYGTSSELITSTEKLQNKVLDQRNIGHYHVKPHPSLFVQNALADISWTQSNHHIWIENSHVPSSWSVSHNHIITGAPGNDWDLVLNPGNCLDIVPIGQTDFCIRTYAMEDSFRGRLGDEHSLWMGLPFRNWLKERGLSFSEAKLQEDMDLQSAPLFPVTNNIKDQGNLVKWMMKGNRDANQRLKWLELPRISADEISSRANLKRLFRQREQFRQQNMGKLAHNFKRSVFYQSDLKFAASEFARAGIEVPDLLPPTEAPVLKCKNHMFRAELLKMKGMDGSEEERKAFEVLQDALIGSTTRNTVPKLNIFSDQIVWGRSPVRLDLAGGWSDTPPYCIQNGGSVLNMAVELNGQPPVQVYIRLSNKYNITLRSIDNGVSESISNFEEIRNYEQVGSAFSVPKAALYLAGFHPDFCGVSYKTLAEQLHEFGGGFEISFLAAVPKGSGLGTSSILAATILGSLSDFCSLRWEHTTICHRTLILEQLLTTGGGWQDQYGGILPGIKLLESLPGPQNRIDVRWMPDRLFTQPEYKDSWLLYYTGVTRIAKNILAEIVRGMFLNEGKRLRIIDDIKQHAHYLAGALQHSDYQLTGKMVARSWKLNNALDSGTNTPEIQQIINLISDFACGFKLPGAGGGGYMLIAAKDPEAAVKIQSVLAQNPPNAKARFVSMEMSQRGFQVSRS